MSRLAAPLLLLAALLGCEHVPEAEIHGVRVKRLAPDLSVPSLDVSFDLLLRVENPFDVAIPVPAHHYRLELGPEPLVPVSGTLPAFSLAPGDNVLRYPIDLHLDPSGPLAALLGTDAAFAFVTELRVDLPNGESWTAPLRMAGEMRLALPPEWSLDASRVPSARPLGNVEQIDLGVLHALIVAVADPVVQASGTPYQKAEWLKFKQNAKVLIPSSLEGVEVAIPLEVRNPNAFAIAAPGLDTALRVGTPRRELASLRLGQAGSPSLAPGATRAMTLRGRFRWAALGEGLESLLTSGETGADASGTLRVDFGYGVTEVPVEAGFSLTLGQ
jgi:hypothetical protein